MRWRPHRSVRPQPAMDQVMTRERKHLVTNVGKSLLAAAMIVAATAVVTLATGTSASAAVQATFYVAPDGDDSNAGSITAPFRTVEHARDVVRTVKSTMTGDIYVYLRG